MQQKVAKQFVPNRCEIYQIEYEGLYKRNLHLGQSSRSEEDQLKPKR